MRDLSLRRRGEGGFSLLEMSILLIIVGILAVPAIEAYNQYKDRTNRQQNRDRVGLVSGALAEFFASNGRYPCPADPQLGPGAPNYGVETINALLNDCIVSPGMREVNSATIPTGAFNNPDDWNLNGTNADDRIVIGSVPFATLRIPVLNSEDTFGSKLVYAVTKNMAALPAGVPAAVSTWGGIQIQQFDQSGVLSLRYNLRDNNGDGIADNDLDSVPNGIPDEGAAHFVVFSTGATRQGGFPKGAYAFGTPPIPCTADGNNTGDDENCDYLTSVAEGGTFLNVITSDVAGANFYDDIISFETFSVAALWRQTGPTNQDLYNVNSGRVGIGTQAPQQKLHVEGNVLVDQVRVQEVCDQSGTRCFNPSVIGGDPLLGTGGMNCISGGTIEYMTGISQGTPDCVSAPVTGVAAIDCSVPPAGGPGQVIKSIVGGVATCGLP